MRTTVRISSLILLVALASCSKNSVAPNRLNASGNSLATSPTVVTLTWGTTYQTVTGFGCFAGRDTQWFTSPYRDTLLSNLFGNSGLGLNIIRGELEYTYPYTASSVTILPTGTSAGTSPTSNTWEGLTLHQKQNLSVYWLLSQATSLYHVPYVIGSAWSPPLAMRVNPSDSTPGFLGYNTLNFNTSSSSYANYLAGIVSSFKSAGVNFYGISPANEPENIVATWTNCPWSASHLGQFITNNLRPALNSAGLNTVKILSPENAAWTTTNSYLGSMDCSNVDIIASHGYVNPVSAALGSSGFDLSPTAPSVTSKPVWMTEACDDAGTADATMTEGIKLATSISNTLTTCNANSYVFWLGMLNYSNNEGMLWAPASGPITYTKDYDVMGNFSRFIPNGYVRFAAAQSGADLYISAFKHPSNGKFTIVAVNASTSAQSCTFNLSGFGATSLTAYLTSDASSAHWASSSVAANSDGTFSVTLPASSVVTYTGVNQ